MTIRGLAKQLGKTPVTVYRRLNANGVNVETLRNEHGDLTDEGVRLIASLFDGATALHEDAQSEYQSVSRETVHGDTSAQVEIAVLRERLKAAEDAIQALTAERDGLRVERDRLLSMLETAQKQQQQLLTAGDQRRGVLSWFRRKG